VTCSICGLFMLDWRFISWLILWIVLYHHHHILCNQCRIVLQTCAVTLIILEPRIRVMIDKWWCSLICSVQFKVCFLFWMALELDTEGLHCFCDLLDLLYLKAVDARRRWQFLFDRSLFKLGYKNHNFIIINNRSRKTFKHDDQDSLCQFSV
jgi:hypothetical protein